MNWFKLHVLPKVSPIKIAKAATQQPPPQNQQQQTQTPQEQEDWYGGQNLFEGAPSAKKRKSRKKKQSFRAPTNPGKYEELTREVREATQIQEAFEGFKLDLQRSFGEQFGVLHSLALGSTDKNEPPASYTFMSHYQNNVVALLARLNTNGDFVARFMQGITNNLALNVITQIQKGPKGEEAVAFEGEVTFKGEDYTTGTKFTHHSGPHGSQKMVGFSYAQGITDKLSAGIESVINIDDVSSVPLMGAIRYTDTDKNGDQWVVTASASTADQYELSYHHTFKNKFKVASDFVLLKPPYSMKPGLTPLWTLGYAYDFNGAVVAKGNIQNFKVLTSILEERIAENIGFQICGHIHYPKNTYKFGFGIQFAA